MIWFTSIQKTGGTSLRNAIKTKNDPKMRFFDHGYVYDPWECKEKENKYWNKYNFKSSANISKDYNPLNTIISVIRNPFDIFVSYFLHAKKDGWGMVNRIHNLHTFDQFTEYYLAPDKEWHLPPMKNSMFSFIYNKQGELISDLCYKLENVDKIETLLAGLRIPPMGFSNKTILKDDYRRYYKTKKIDALNKVWKRDLEHFKYTFE
jgi:hypothetical protein